MQCELVDLGNTSDEFLFVASLLRHIPSARLVQLERIQHRHLRLQFLQRAESIARLNGNDSNQCWTWFGSSDFTPRDILSGPDGLDPRHSTGGFYGRGVYLSDDPCYQIGGRCECLPILAVPARVPSFSPLPPSRTE